MYIINNHLSHLLNLYDSALTKKREPIIAFLFVCHDPFSLVRVKLSTLNVDTHIKYVRKNLDVKKKFKSQINRKVVYDIMVSKAMGYTYMSLTSKFVKK